MTESEAIKEIIHEVCNEKWVSSRCRDRCMYGEERCVYSMAIKALEEVQRYRELGTIEEFKDLKDGKLSGRELAMIAVDVNKLKKYRAIGTVEECREAMEKQRAKKPVKYGDTRQGLDNDGNSISWQEDCYECPTCGSFLGYVIDCEDEQYQDGYCRNCGQAISWESDTP